MENKMKYEIVASDLDGTLLGEDQIVSAENLAAISEMNRLGVKFVPTTGRSLGEIPKELKESADVRYIITSDGAAIWDKELGDMMITHYIPRDLVKFIIEVENSCTSYSIAHVSGKTYYDAKRHTPENLDACRLDGYFRKLIAERTEPISDYDGLLSSSDTVEMIVIFFESDAELERARRLLLESGRLGISQTAPNNLEIYLSSAGKGRSLKALADKIGVDISAVIAVGDSLNDTELVKTASLGLAMENAHAALKEIADKVICHVSEHSAKYILDNFLF